MQIEKIKNLKNSLVDLKKGIGGFQINETWFRLLNEIIDELIKLKQTK